jgi:hypothetical protein
VMTDAPAIAKDASKQTDTGKSLEIPRDHRPASAHCLAVNRIGRLPIRCIG